ncbi:hypothetical protein E2C01_068433 [Portunus trituberculatus]|uniref:Uncharacterized protein n=1 Tax=Portunus trituberculatus TaxID=210409 RepID=A0A5B7HZF2_PORTR|nr:hypothetical protein [Portunus trituberculatus]
MTAVAGEGMERSSRSPEAAGAQAGCSSGETRNQLGERQGVHRGARAEMSRAVRMSQSFGADWRVLG